MKNKQIKRLLVSICLFFLMVLWQSFPLPGASITVLSPNGGEEWQLGSIQQITWTAEGVVDPVKISLWQEGVKLGIIASDVDPASGSFTWTAGEYYDGGFAAAGTGYTVKIKEMNKAVYDLSDAPFTLSQVTVTSPNGGEEWQLGSIQEITWTAEGVVDPVKISLWQEGVKLGIIASDVDPASGSFTWTAGEYYDGGFAAAGTGYTVKIKEMNKAIYDLSDAPFTLYSSVIPPPSHFFAKSRNSSVYLGWRWHSQHTEYDIYRKEAGQGEDEYLKIGSVADSTNYLDTSVAVSTAYDYYVVGLGENGDVGGRSNVAAATVVSGNNNFIYKTISGITASTDVSIAKVGDINGDGLPDFLTISHQFDTDSGKFIETYKVKLYLNGSSEPDTTIDMEEGSDCKPNDCPLKWCPWTFWDMDHDGKDELIGVKRTGTAYYLYIIDANGINSGESWISGNGNVLASTILASHNNSTIRWKSIAIAYLNGQEPWILYKSGHYASDDKYVTAYDQQLNKKWEFHEAKDEGIDSSHQFEVADIDEDGKDEAFLGVYVFDESGRVPGYWGGHAWSHIDGVHIGDIDPDNSGQEVYFHQERKAPGGTHVTDNSGNILWGPHKHGGAPPSPCDSDPNCAPQHAHLGWIGDVVSNTAGMECWVKYKAPGDPGCMYNPHLYDRNGNILKGVYKSPPYNPEEGHTLLGAVDWNGETPLEVVRQNGELVNFNDNGSGYGASHGYFSGTNFWMDIIGDYREELIAFGQTGGYLWMKVYTNTNEITTRKLSPCQDRQYLQKHRWAGH